MSNQKLQSEQWKTELEERLRELSEFLKYKNHGYCIKYLNNIIKDFFKKQIGNNKSIKEVNEI